MAHKFTLIEYGPVVRRHVLFTEQEILKENHYQFDLKDDNSDCVNNLVQGISVKPLFKTCILTIERI